MRPPPAPPLAAMVVVLVVGLGEAGVEKAARATPRGGAVDRTGPELEVEVAAGAELVLLLLVLVLVRKAPSVECEALRVELVIERVARWWRRVCVSGDLGRGISGQDGGRRWWTVGGSRFDRACERERSRRLLAMGGLYARDAVE